MSEPKDLKYTKEHEWARIEDGAATVGITNYAQEQLGDIVFIELPAPGEEVTMGEAFGVIESVKAVSDLFAPLSGEVAEINDFLIDAPEIMNSNPYDKGWMLKIKCSNPGEADKLMDSEAYEKFLEKEKGK